MGSGGGSAWNLTYLQSGLAAILVHSKSLLLGGQCAAQQRTFAPNSHMPLALLKPVL